MLRAGILRKLERPIVLETHGGIGRLWEMVYSDLPFGVVIEKDYIKVEKLARMRPTWSVYEGNCEVLLEAGLASHVPVNMLDVDPYGDSWVALEAWFVSDRLRAPKLGIAVNDGLRTRLHIGKGWDTESLKPALDRFGNAEMYSRYLEVCEWNMRRLAAMAGYELREWTAYYTGQKETMTHFGAILTRGAA